MNQETKDTIYQIFIIAGLILFSLLVMYFSYKQARSYYYDSNGNPKENLQKVFTYKDVARVHQK